MTESPLPPDAGRPLSSTPVHGRPADAMDDDAARRASDAWDPDDAAQPTPGGPYFGRLLVVLFAAVVFCGLMTWFLSSVVAP